MKKKRVLFALIMLVSSVLARTQELKDVPLEEIRYFEKLRWTEDYGAATISRMFIHFIPPPAERYYKTKYRTTGGEYSFPVAGMYRYLFL